MATKPTVRQPTWATDGGADITDPGAGQQADGWDVDDKPPAGWMNWWKNAVGQWTDYFEDQTDENETNITTNTGDIATLTTDLAKAKNDAQAMSYLTWTNVTSQELRDAARIAKAFKSNSTRTIVLATAPDDAIHSTIGQDYGIAAAAATSSANVLGLAVPLTGTNEHVALLVRDGNTETWSYESSVWSQRVDPPGAPNLLESNGTGTVVAVGGGGSARTTDLGDTWTSGTGAVDNVEHLKYFSSGSLWVASGTNQCWTSTDGITWTDRSAFLPSGIQNIIGVEYLAGLGIWMVVGGDASNNLTAYQTPNSPAIGGWTLLGTGFPAEAPVANSSYRFVSDRDKFAYVRYGSDYRGAMSYDGLAWQATRGPDIGLFGNLVFDDGLGRFVLLGGEDNAASQGATVFISGPKNPF